MRVLAFSDIHCDLDAVGAIVEAAADADLVIGAGDFAQIHRGLEETMAAFQPIEDRSIFIPGNNETLEALKEATDALILHGQSIDIDGTVIAGIGCAIPPLPPTPWGSFDMTEVDAEGALSGLEADILITHSPPKGIVDHHADLGSLGSVAVRGWIKDHQPKLVFCGHIHDCWGQSGEIGASKIYNLGPKVNWFDYE